jgi:uncharacterized protein YdeI (YjbR/CyaY-like superfamily)
MELKNGIKTFYARSRSEWRSWLEQNQSIEKCIWLIIYHKDSNKRGISYEEAVEEALCFGWIDSKALKRDDSSYYLYFAVRNLNSNWSKVNKERVERMVSAALMTSTGQAMIDHAKASGTWSALDLIDNLAIPDDLQKLFKKNKKAAMHFEAFPASSKKMILQWILSAKKRETREQRIRETVELAARNVRAHHPTPGSKE